MNSSSNFKRFDLPFLFSNTIFICVMLIPLSNSRCPSWSAQGLLHGSLLGRNGCAKRMCTSGTLWSLSTSQAAHIFFPACWTGACKTMLQRLCHGVSSSWLACTIHTYLVKFLVFLPTKDDIIACHRSLSAFGIGTWSEQTKRKAAQKIPILPVNVQAQALLPGRGTPVPYLFHCLPRYQA